MTSIDDITALAEFQKRQEAGSESARASRWGR
jgi:hypothetical protein